MEVHEGEDRIINDGFFPVSIVYLGSVMYFDHLPPGMAPCLRDLLQSVTFFFDWDSSGEISNPFLNSMMCIAISLSFSRSCFRLSLAHFLVRILAAGITLNEG